MNIKVSKEAAQWFLNEMDLQKGDYVQFFIKLYGGIPTIHSNYFLGISIGKEGSIAVKDEVEGITFYFNDQDSWFLEQYDIRVVIENDEVNFIFNNK
jgi:uncharacterized protein YneR